MAQLYRAHSLLLRSDLALPWPAACGRGRAQVRVRLLRGPGAALLSPAHRCVAESEPHSSPSELELWRGPGDVVLNYQGVAAYRLVPDEQLIEVAPESDACASLLAEHLLDTPLALMLLWRGLLPVHASAVAHKGEALVFVAPAGTGKSTLAAACVCHGAALLADDVTVLAPGERGSLVRACQPVLRLSERALGELRLGERCQVLRSRPGEKVLVLVSRPELDACQLPLRALYFLSRARDGAARGQGDLSLAECVARLSAGMFAFTALPPAERGPFLRATAAVVASTPCVPLELPRGFSATLDLAADLLSHGRGESCRAVPGGRSATDRPRGSWRRPAAGGAAELEH